MSDVIQAAKVKLVKYAVLGVAALLGFLFLNPVNSVPTGYRGVVTVGGAIRGVESEGFVLLAPWQKLDNFSIRAEQADVKGAEGATVDQQPVNVSMTVRYAIQTNKVAEVYEKYSHNGDLSSYVQTATHEAFKAVTANYTAPNLLAQRSKVSADIRSALQTKLSVYGAQVINIDMTGFAFSPEYMKAINNKTTQEQLKLAADNMLKTVESEQKQKVAVAEAEATALKATADGQAYALLADAKAKAQSIEIQAKALQQNKDILELRRIEVEMVKAQQWKGALPTNVYGSAPIPFLDVSK